ncbi:MAG: aminoacyl-tRNA hydrolase [Dehalococcoidia bacterium]
MRKLFGGTGGPRFAADWLIVGLGNPGEEYARNRHNLGFWVVNDLAKRSGTQPKVAGSTMLIGVGNLAGAAVALVKPRTYVNVSGKAVLQAQQWTGCDTGHTIVVYDELDMAVGALRIRAGGGSGGHNGLKSITSSVGANFIRVRVGIGRPQHNGEPSWDPEVVAAYVLGNPAGEERTLLEETARAAADAVEAVISEGAEAAGSKFNRK